MSKRPLMQVRACTPPLPPFTPTPQAQTTTTPTHLYKGGWWGYAVVVRVERGGYDQKQSKREASRIPL